MLAQGQLLDAAAPIYTVPASTTAQVKTLVFFNGDAASTTVEVYLVPNASGSPGVASAANQVLSLTLSPNDTIEFSPSYPITYSAENDTIQAKATVASTVSYFVMGVEV